MWNQSQTEQYLHSLKIWEMSAKPKNEITMNME